MAFITDQETLEDLNIPGRYRPDSIYSLFNRVVTAGGERLLSTFFNTPLTDHREINERAATFALFAEQELTLPFTADAFEVVEDFVGAQAPVSRAGTWFRLCQKRLSALAVNDDGYQQLHHQVVTVVELLQKFARFLKTVRWSDTQNAFFKDLEDLSKAFDTGCFRKLVSFEVKGSLSLTRMAGLYYELAKRCNQELKSVLQLIYRMDVYIAVSAVGREKKFCYAKALPAAMNTLCVEQLRHPKVQKAVGNSLYFTQKENLVFLTGANMAGKSTFMKALGIAFYLAHMGFPVPAESMEFSVKKGLFSSINVSDNLSAGYSHFYAEVLRVKKAAEAIADGVEALILFDELFKGTNVKDAYDATVAVTEGFLKRKQCFFIVSTHITEAGEELRRRCAGIRFTYFPSILNGGARYNYPYLLEQGISNDRHGMRIIMNEGILELIRLS